VRIFSRKAIKCVEDEFSKSSFVKDTIGVASVCEPCACLGGGKLIVNKTVINGITIAIAREGKYV
jgi:cobalt-precorrin 5A hydrolase